ncbi:A24 family peptidase [Amycolatopsis sp. NPDC004079]|uniref:A24 family peptidase n=1 Tax=Amycolatopsis sp. NPDC004079 TaxID=3154549 RepID=UPI0033B93A54
MVLTAVLAAGAVVPVLLVMMKKADAPIPAVLAVAVAAAAAAVAAARADVGALPAWWLPVAWLVSVLGAPLALADARHRRLPDILTLPAYPAVALTITLAALSGGGWRLAAGAALGCLLFGGTHLIVHRLSAGGLGPGDVKLAGSFGAVLGAIGGLAPAVAAVLAALVSLAAVVPMWLIRRFRDSRASTLAPSRQPGPGTPLAAVQPLGGLDEPTPNQLDIAPQPTEPAQTPRSAAAASAPTDVTCLPTDPAPAPTSAAPTSPPSPASSRIRAGPLRVPYGPGLVLATWACAVFPAAGTGIT